MAFQPCSSRNSAQKKQKFYPLRRALFFWVDVYLFYVFLSSSFLWVVNIDNCYVLAKRLVLVLGVVAIDPNQTKYVFRHEGVAFHEATDWKVLLA